MKIRKFGIALAIIAVAIPVVSFAALTSDQIAQIISKLNDFGADSAVVSNVQSILNSNNSGNQQETTAWCHTFTKYLYVGVNDQEVAQLIEALRKEGIYPTTRENYTTFNEPLAEQVVQFQQKYDITLTGTVGPTTRAKLNSLYGCGNSTQPSITVTSPNGGESLRLGDTVRLHWDYSNISADAKVWLVIKDYNDGYPYPNKQYPVNVLAGGGNGGLPITQKGFDWTISSNFVTGAKMKLAINVNSPIYGQNMTDESDNYFTIAAAGTGGISLQNSSAAVAATQGSTFQISCDYGVKLNCIRPETAAGNCTFTGWATNGTTANFNCLASNTGVKTNYCTIFNYSGDSRCVAQRTQINSTTVGTTAQPSITVTSPNGGETWQAGTTHNITWTGGTGNTGIYLYKWITRLTDEGNGYGSPVLAIAANTIPNGQKQFFWNIPSTLTPDQYYIRLTDTTSGDNSDNYFTISAAGTTTCTPSWQTGSWSACVSGQQTRTVTDSNNCGVTTNMPATSQACTADTVINNGPVGITSFITDKNSLTTVSGQTITFSWDSGGADTCKIWIPGLNYFSPDYPVSQKTASYTYNNAGVYLTYLTCSNTASNATKSLNINVLSSVPALSLKSSSAPASVSYGSNYQITCDFGDVGDTRLACVAPISDAGNCTFSGYSGTAATFSCIANKNTGLQSNYCNIISYPKDYRCLAPQQNKIQSTNVTAAVQPSSIAVTSPTSGQRLIKGNTYNITWNSTGITNVLIIWQNTGTGATGWITPANSLGRHVVSNTGSYSWSVPSDLASGQYIIQVFNYTPDNPGAGGTYADLPQANSATFSVAGLTETYNNSQSSLASIADAFAQILAQVKSLLVK